MPMNEAHRTLCSSAEWATAVRELILPFALADVGLGDDVLEIGPGFGATTRVLVEQVPTLTAVEIDEASVRLLEAEFGGRATIVHGDGAALSFPDGRFSGVVCFTMLHHVPSSEQQDALFFEAARVLRPGGVFAGSDSVMSEPFRELHVGDTMVVVDPDTLPARLGAAGFTEPTVDLVEGGMRFRARKP